jgi:glycosyltransferase involved in cell wall biosynthesis
MSVGTIVIGRNEGERLRRAFESIPSGAAKVLYVDSGSSDGSVALARSMGVDVHELDPEKPFSAARARREGVEVMLKDHPDLEAIQFLDGDCTLEKGWSEKAIAHLSAHPNAAIVCGLLTEANTERSIYNRFIAVRWNATIGDIDACGGIFMIRICVYKSVGGFNSALLTGEEAELCARVRKAGHRIVRLDTKMACHDADLVSFGQWWGRAVWGGFGDAMEYDVLKGGVSAARHRETRSIVIWVATAPLLGLLGAIGAYWLPWLIGLPVVCALAYPALVVRVGMDRLRRGDSFADSAIYAFFCVLRKFPYAIGFFKYRLFPSSRAKVPDPHAPMESVDMERVSQ